MAGYPYLVQTAWYVIEQFIDDWQREPYRWYQEIDIQTEISNRLKQIYQLIGEDSILMKSHYKVQGLTDIQKFSRVTCQTYVSYTDSDGKDFSCVPDIIVWDEVDDLEKYPEGISSSWPILWACEIKYSGVKHGDWDQEKLRYLVEQSRAKFGCWLQFYLERSNYGDGIKWKKAGKDPKIWIGEIRLPAEED